MEFANKEYLLLLLLLIPYLVWYLMYRKKAEPTIRLGDTNAYRYAPRSWKVTLMPLQPLLRIRLRTGGADTGSSADTELMEEPNGRRNRYYAGNGRVYVDVGRRPEAQPYRGCQKGCC